MKLNKEQMIAIAVILTGLVIFGAVYQFYYQQRLVEYAENRETLKTLEGVLKDLEEKFESKDPETLIKSINAKVEPLAQEVVQRAQFFNTAEALQIDPIPEGKMVRFWYSEQYAKFFDELREDASSRNPYIELPESTFGSPRPEELEGKTVEQADATRWLRNIRFGCFMSRMLMDAKAQAIYELEVWPRWEGYDKMIVGRTVGVSFLMNYKDLISFLDKLRMENRYFNINALSIQNRYLRWQTEPPVEVKMLITQANINQQDAPPTQRANAGKTAVRKGEGGANQRLRNEGFKSGRRGEPDEDAPPPTRWQKFMQWLKDKGYWY